jgi:hypothetical protein
MGSCACGSEDRLDQGLNNGVYVMSGLTQSAWSGCAMTGVVGGLHVP